MSNQKKDEALTALGLHVGADKAAAIAVFVDGRIAAVVGGLRKELAAIVVAQKENVAAAKKDGSVEAAKVANAGTKATKVADEAVKEAAADPTPKKAEVAAAAVKTAAAKTKEASDALEARMKAVEATVAPWRRGEQLGDRTPSRFDPIEQDLAKVRGEMDQIASASAEALAVARGRDDDHPIWVVSLVVFVVAWTIAAVMAAFTPLSLFWDGFGLALGTAALVALVLGVLSLLPAFKSGFAAGRAQAQARANSSQTAAVEAETTVGHESAAKAKASAR